MEGKQTAQMRNAPAKAIFMTLENNFLDVVQLYQQVYLNITSVLVEVGFQMLKAFFCLNLLVIYHCHSFTVSAKQNSRNFLNFF